MFNYRIRMRHDNGVVTINTTAANRDAAISQVIAAERAPSRAIISVLELVIPFREHELWQARGFNAHGQHFNRAFSRKRDCERFINAMARGRTDVARY